MIVTELKMSVFVISQQEGLTLGLIVAVNKQTKQNKKKRQQKGRFF